MVQSPVRKWGSLVVLSLALAIIIIDTTLLNVSLATIIREFKTDIQSIQWVITAYSLTLAALTITGGRLGDFFGRKRMFVLGAVIFALGSFIASISHTVSTMIIGESIIEGIGAALMMPATSSLLVANFRGRDRAIAFGVWGGIAAAAAAIGPILGGYLATNYSWRWGFRINIVIALILFIGAFIIPESHDEEEKPVLDWLGVFLSATGLLAFVFGIIESSRYGWWQAKEMLTIGQTQFQFLGNLSIVPYAIAFGLLILLLFVLWEQEVDESGRTPLVSMRLFQNRQFASGSLTTAFLSLGQSGIIFAIPVFLQAVRGLDAYHTGLTLLPLSLTILVVAPLSAFLSHKFNPKFIIQLGLFLNILSLIVLRSSITVNATGASLAPGFILFGAGMGMVMAQISNLTLSAVSVQEAGEASGVNNTLRQVGSTLGSAIIGAVLLGALSSNLSAGILKSPVIPASLKYKLAQNVSQQTTQVEFGGGAKLGQAIPPAVSREITQISHQATVDANRKAMAYGGIFAVLGFFVSFLLPNMKNSEKEQSVASGH